jgi:hypothetical protein
MSQRRVGALSASAKLHRKDESVGRKQVTTVATEAKLDHRARVIHINADSGRQLMLIKKAGGFDVNNPFSGKLPATSLRCPKIRKSRTIRCRIMPTTRACYFIEWNCIKSTAYI